MTLTLRIEPEALDELDAAVADVGLRGHVDGRVVVENTILPSPAKSPVSVILSADLRRKLEREAKKRGLGLSPALRTLVVERLRELEDSAQLSRVELWQRAQAWASWQDAERGDNPEVAWTEVDAAFDRAAASRRRR